MFDDLAGSNPIARPPPLDFSAPPPPPCTWKGDDCPAQATRPYSLADSGNRGFSMATPLTSEINKYSLKGGKNTEIKTFKYEKPKGTGWKEAKDKRNFEFLGKSLLCSPAH